MLRGPYELKLFRFGLEHVRDLADEVMLLHARATAKDPTRAPREQEIMWEDMKRKLEKQSVWLESLLEIFTVVGDEEWPRLR